MKDIFLNTTILVSKKKFEGMNILEFIEAFFGQLKLSCFI